MAMRGNLLAVAEAEMRPRFAGVNGFVDAVASGKIGPLKPFAAADVNDVGIGKGHGDRADRTGGLIVEYRLPGIAEVC